MELGACGWLAAGASKFKGCTRVPLALAAGVGTAVQPWLKSLLLLADALVAFLNF
jgi:hypothetical protein